METDNLLSKAKTALAKGESQEAFDLACQLTALAPTLPKAYEIAARAAGVQNQWSLAAAQWRALTFLQPNRISAYSQAVNAYKKCHNLEAALAIIEAAIENNPKTLSLLVSKFELLQLTNANDRTSGTRREIESLLAISNDTKTAITYAKILSKNGEYDSAVKTLELVLSKSKSDLNGIETIALNTALARILYDAKYYAQSRNLWLKFVDLGTENNQYEVNIFLAKIASKLALPNELIKHAIRADELDPTSDGALQLLVRHYQTTNETDLTIQYASEGHKRFPDVEAFLLCLASSYSQKNDVANANSYFIKAINQWPDRLHIIKAYATHLYDASDNDALVKFHQSRVRLNPTCAESSLNLAQCLYRLQRWTDLFEFLKDNWLTQDTEAQKPHEQALELLSKTAVKIRNATVLSHSLDIARQHYPLNLNFWLRSIQMYVNADKTTSVNSTLKEAYQYFPDNNSEGLLNRVKLQVGAEYFSEAKILIEIILDNSPRSNSENTFQTDQSRDAVDQFSTEAKIILTRILMNEGLFEKAKPIINELNKTPSLKKSDGVFLAQSLARIETYEAKTNFSQGTSSTRKMPEVLITQIASQNTVRTIRENTEESVLIVTSTLRPGGAERQVVATAQGLTELNSAAKTVSTLAFKLDSYNKSDFYRKDLEATDSNLISVMDIEESGLVDQLLEEDSKAVEDIQLLNAMGTEFSNHGVPLYAWLRKEKPTTIQAWQDSTNIVCAMAAILAGVERIVLTTCSTRPDGRRRSRTYLKPAYQALIKRSDVVIINNSDAGAIDYENWLELPRGEIKTVYNGLDINTLKARASERSAESVRELSGFSKDTEILGGVMRFSEEKRPDLWVETAIKVLEKRPACRFLLIGDGPMRAALIEKVTTLGLQEKIKMPGTYRPVESWMAAMDLLFLSSRREGLPNVLIEAQALGVPVVSTHVGGAGEAFLHEESGWLLESSNPSCIATTIDKLLADKKWLGRASLKAKEHVMAKFSTESLGRHTSASFEQCIPIANHAQTQRVA